MATQNNESLSGGIRKSGQDQYSAVGKIANAPRSDLDLSDLNKPTGNQNFSAGQYANTLQGNQSQGKRVPKKIQTLSTKEMDAKISGEEESEYDFGEGERLGESYAQSMRQADAESRDQDARHSLVEEDAAFGEVEDPQGHGEKPAYGRETLPPMKQAKSKAGIFSPSEQPRDLKR